jgi:hypothetical protein
MDVPDLDVVPDPDALPDTAEVTCEPAYWWELVDRTIDSVVLLDGVSPRMGVTERLIVAVQLLSACERLAWIDVDVMSGDATDFVEFRAQAWAPTGLDCPPSAPIVTWMVTIEGREQGNFMAVVTDGNSPGGGLRLNYDRETCSGIPDCSCWPGTPDGTATEGQACVTDCSCESGLSCIGFHGIAGPMWSCLVPCNDFQDCPDGERCLPGPIPDYTSHVCETGDRVCGVDADCPTGFECNAMDRCIDARDFSVVDAGCTCDEQCPGGQHCTLWDPIVGTMCLVPCLRDAECDLFGSCLHGVCLLPPP